MSKFRFTVANAREFAAKSVASRKERKIERETVTESVVVPAGIQASDPFAVELMRAQAETLKELRAAENAKDRAACARALRELRETWHMVTGEPRPGIRKDSGRQPRRKVETSAGFELPTDAPSVGQPPNPS